jgi:hypothetical protein
MRGHDLCRREKPLIQEGTVRNWQKSDAVELTIVAGMFVALVLGVHGTIATLNFLTQVKSSHIVRMGLCELAIAGLVAWFLVRLNATGEFPSLQAIRGELKRPFGAMPKSKKKR